jgi:uncharacterized protein YegP (UPF0339 family)
MSDSTLEVYQRADKRWAWRLRAGNGAIVATDGGQGYENRADCARVARAVVAGLYSSEPIGDKLQAIQDALLWWERPDRPHLDGSALAKTIRTILEGD